MPIPEIKEDDLDARIGKVIKQLCEGRQHMGSRDGSFRCTARSRLE
jgi:hypothetical protein